MSEKGRVLAVIPARAGSKGLPGKNHLTLSGKPLIQWTIEAALQTSGIDQVIVSSDDEMVINLANSLGVLAHRRAEALSSDTAQASAVIADALAHFPGFQTLVYLQPTSPLRASIHIEEALQRFNLGLKVPVISVTTVTQPPEWMYTIGVDGSMVPYILSEELRRQDTKIKYIPNGAIYIADIHSLSENGFVFAKSSPQPYVMDSRTSIDIDDKFDFDLAEWIIEQSN
jgi:CMP-N,N'-diacetyllegionaminic acid synthase